MGKKKVPLAENFKKRFRFVWALGDFEEKRKAHQFVKASPRGKKLLTGRRGLTRLQSEKQKSGAQRFVVKTSAEAERETGVDHRWFGGDRRGKEKKEGEVGI